MKGYKFSALLQKVGWLSPAFVLIDDGGKIISIDKKPLDSIHYEEGSGFAVPAFTNAHSHAFQYAMVGLAEVHQPGSNADDFWSWRNKMYEIALAIGPEELQAIATMLYAEMVRHGYAHVVEFHYLHHDRNGEKYENIAELGERLIAAAFDAGINITLVPMLYQKGGFDQPPSEKQRRFISSDEEYSNICQIITQKTQQLDHAYFGYGAHSLRAASKDSIKTIINEYQQNYPFHIHIAEQLKEVEDSLSNLGKRPVEWLLDNFEVNKNFNLVHATHLTNEETVELTRSKANVVLCPSTEGNLGDGIFPLRDYQDNDGRWCIGTDSHIGLSPLEELRLLDYGQRLINHKRNTFAADDGNSAHYAFNQFIINGRRAAGIDSEDYFEVGKPFNAVIFDENHPLLLSDEKYWLNTILYHYDVSNIYGTIINGQWIVKGGFHKGQLTIREKFRDTLKKLKFRMR